MRTDDQLRAALVPESEEAGRAERLTDAILARAAAPDHRRRPVVIGLAVAVTLAVVVGLAVTNLPRAATPADPPTPTTSATPTPPPNDRVEGNWRLTHRVDPPPGWTVVGHGVSDTSDSTSLTGPDGATRCGVTVLGVGEALPPAPGKRRRTEYAGRPAYTGVSGREAQLAWQYRDDGWATVTCSVDDEFATVREIAGWVVFEPTEMRVPIRLTWVPDGFRVVSAAEQDFAGGRRGDWTLWQTDPNGFAISVSTYPASEWDLQPGQPGTVTDVVAGYPAILQAEWHRIELDAGDYTVMLTADGYRNGQTAWAPGRKDLLIRFTESIELAADLGDRSTWFAADQAVPR